MLIPAMGQQAIIKGRVFNSINNEPISFANVAVQGTSIGTITDTAGNFMLNVQPGLYNLQVSFLGFKPKTIYEIQATNARPAQVDIGLVEDEEQLKEVVVRASPFAKPEESPVSLRKLGVNEIQRNPGGNRDISKVIQSLPGVATTVSFRNDILIRGGAPNENRFYLDGIEVPNINHFATQGASGGPVGMINVDFIKEVDFYSGAFPANRGNALSSVMEISQRDGRDDRLGFTATLGASDLGVTLEGPLGKRSTFLLSARRSYLQFLFKLLELPFLPTYNDFQYKHRIKIDEKNDIAIIGLAAIDQFDLNLDQDETELQRYILNNLPENEQWNYTVGMRYRHFTDNGYYTAVISRNHLDNSAYKYLNNDESNPGNLILDYRSEEIENKLRLEHTLRKKGYKLNYGLNYEYVTYTNSSYIKTSTPAGIITDNYNSKLNINKYGLFTQLSKGLLQERLILSLGLRTDWNDYSDKMDNPLEQLSPRFSASYRLSTQWSLNFNTGWYCQLPPYTSLGYRNSAGVLVNRGNGLSYINNKHVVGGVEYISSSNTKFTMEGFYKKYDNYPFLLRDSISLANLGGDFGVIGDEPVVSTSEGRTYGAEFLAHQKLYKGFYGILAYTYVRSQFKDKNNDYVPSSWDSEHIISLTGGKKFKRNWEVGFKWRFTSGAPYTPYDIAYSSLVPVYDVNAMGIPDFDRLNSERYEPIHQLDVRVDKKYYFKKWSLDFYLDIQNLYNYQATLQPYLAVERDDAGQPVTDPASDPQNPRYKTYLLENTSGSVIPTIGVVVEL